MRAVVGAGEGEAAVAGAVVVVEAEAEAEEARERLKDSEPPFSASLSHGVGVRRGEVWAEVAEGKVRERIEAEVEAAFRSGV